MKNRRRTAIAVITIAAVVAAACGGGDEPVADDPVPTEDPGDAGPSVITVTSEDGDLVVEVRADEASASEVAIAILEPADFPPELAGAEQTPGTVIYRLTPDGATFNEPVAVTRRFDASNFDLDPGQLPIVGGLTRGTDGTYEVLDDLSIRRDADDVYVSGATSHFSDVVYVREAGVVSPIVLDLPADVLDQIDADFDFGLGPNDNVVEVVGLECDSDAGSIHVVRQLTDADIASMDALVDELLGPEIEFTIPVSVTCENSEAAAFPDRLDLTVFSSVEHGTNDSDVLFQFAPTDFPPGFEPALGLGLDAGCDGPDGSDQLVNAPFPFDDVDGRLTSAQKIFTFGCYFPLLTPRPADVDAATLDELLALFPEAVYTPAAGDALEIIDVGAEQEIFADGFESGDTTAWSITRP